MPRARWILLFSLITASASHVAAAFPQDGAGNRAPQPRPGANTPAKQAQAARPPATMEGLLKDWERQSAKLKTLKVWIYRIDRTPAWDEEIHYEGLAIFQSPHLAYLDFKRLKTMRDAKTKKLVPAPDPQDPKKRYGIREETIICGQNEVWQYLHPAKEIFVHPLAKEQRQRALDEGPLPFLFNMKAAEAEARYDMKLQGEDQKYYSVLVYPKLAADKEAFRVAQIILDKQWLLPVRITLISPDKKSSKDFQFEHVLPNAEVEASWFVGRPVKGWKLVRNPQAVAAPAADVGARPAPPARGQARPR
jgi:TIGR03009 family protein